eukprot:5673412-Prymnesium_polylepis.1
MGCGGSKAGKAEQNKDFVGDPVAPVEPAAGGAGEPARTAKGVTLVEPDKAKKDAEVNSRTSEAELVLKK